jgi:hypothetical protein
MFDKLMEMLREKKAGEFADPSNPVYSEAEEDDEPFEDEAPRSGFTMQLKHRRKSAFLKKMLADQGYDDLARMISIKENK